MAATKKAPARKPARKKAPAKAKAKAAPKAKAEAREEQNGVTRPAPGTQSARVWEVADAISKKIRKPARRKDVIDVVCDQEGMNKATASTQFGRWRQFNSLGIHAKG